MTRPADQIDTHPGPLSLPLVVDRGLLARILAVLRLSAAPMRCFWCREPLTGSTCATCDAAGVEAW